MQFLKASAIAVAIGLAAANAAAAKQRSVPSSSVSVAEVRSLALAALGDREALRRLVAIKATGSIEVFGGFPGRAEIVWEAPAKRMLRWDIGFRRQSITTDGENGWSDLANTREIGGAELVRARRDARFNLLFQLLDSNAPATLKEGECRPGRPSYFLRFRSAGQPDDLFGIDQNSHLPICYSRAELYEEGLVQVRTNWSDYRLVDGVRLPFSIEEWRPDTAFKLKIEKYELQSKSNAEYFDVPKALVSTDSIQLQLNTSPAHVYAEGDGSYFLAEQRHGGAYFYGNTSWSLDVLVKEKHGRYVAPEDARADFYSDGRKVGSQEWSRETLELMRRTPVVALDPQDEIYGFRHNFSSPEQERIDRIVYTFTALTKNHETVSASVEVPIQEYHDLNKYIFPIKGKFMVVTGHEFYEMSHKFDPSQQFSFDIVGLGDDFQLATNDGTQAKDFVAYAQREILAPASGVVVYARSDLPDGDVTEQALEAGGGLPLFAGNAVVIDHGNQEYSLFCHMHEGSIRVKVGQRINQGDVIGLLGASAAPGHPHLHYQLQNGPTIFGAEGLPVTFTNIEPVGWFDDREVHVVRPQRGVYMRAN